MQIVLLGSGNVATHLGRSLKLSGIDIVQVWSRNHNHARQLADMLAAKAVKKTAEITTLADIYLIAVADDAIANVAQSIPAVNKFFVHTSGSTGLDALTPYTSEAGVLYPLQTFLKNKAVDLRQVPVAIEATTEKRLAVLRSVAERLTEKVISIDPEQRLALHLSAVFACNFTNHLYAIARQLLEQHHLSFDLLKPLISETAARVMDHSPADVQTGPAVRGDKNILARHTAFLQHEPRLQEIYEKLSQSIANLHHKAGRL